MTVCAVVMAPSAVLWGVHLWANFDLEKTCNEAMSTLPTVIPQRLFLDVTDEWGRRLTGGERLRIESSLRAAIGLYDFSDRIIVHLEGDLGNLGPGDHVAYPAVELGHEITVLSPVGAHPWKQDYVLGIGGRMCSNLVLVAYTDSPPILTLRFIHEMGHFFGLYHKAGTYVRAGCFFVNPEMDRFNARQLELLDRWDNPGNPYVTHWDQMKLNGESPGPSSTSFHLGLYEVGAGGVAAALGLLIGAVVVWILVIRTERRGRREPREPL